MAVTLKYTDKQSEGLHATWAYSCGSVDGSPVNNNDDDDNDNIDCIKRHNLRFFTISSLCREVSPTRTLKWPGRNHVQIISNTSIAHHMFATWYEGTV